MTLNKIRSKEKHEDGAHYYMADYEMGGYIVTHYLTKYSDCDVIERFEIFAKDRTSYLPKIYYSDGHFGKKEKSFEIQTTAYGALNPEEIKKVIAGYQEAIEAVETLKQEFINVIY